MPPISSAIPAGLQKLNHDLTLVLLHLCNLRNLWIDFSVLYLE